MNVTHSLANSFAALNVNGTPPQQKAMSPGVANYYMPAVFPFDSNIKPAEYPSHPYSPCISTSVPYDDGVSKPFRRNLFGPVDDNVPQATDMMMRGVLPHDGMPDRDGSMQTNLLISPQQTPGGSLALQKYPDLSVSVPEFVPRNGREENLAASQVGSNQLLPSDSGGSPINGTLDASYTELNSMMVQNIGVPNSVTYQENVNGTVYFYTAPVTPSRTSSLLVNKTSVLAASPASDHIIQTGIPTSPNALYPSTKFQQLQIPVPIRQDPVAPYFVPGLQPENLIIAPDPQLFPIPAKVRNFRDLELLDSLPQVSSISFPGCLSSVYKAADEKDGTVYCLRRIHGMGLPSTKCASLINTLKQLSHTNLVTLHDVFPTVDFGDESLVFVYDYYEDCKTLLSKHFSSEIEGFNGFLDTFSSDPNAPRPYSHTKNALLRHSNMALPETLLWNYAIQLTGALRVIHAAGLSCRCVNPTKILSTGNDRLRIGGIGVNDLIMYDHSLTNRKTMTAHFQKEDLISLGKLLLAMACGSLIAIQDENIHTSLDVMSRTYSKEMKNLISTLLLASVNQKRNVTDLLPLIGTKFYSQIDTMQLHCDALENEKVKEADSRNLLKLMIKLSLINECSNIGVVFSPEEGEDKHKLSCFRDYLFGQVTDDQRPRLDIGRIIRCLRKLENGSAETIQLLPKDAGGMPAEVSYSELKLCFERVFRKLSYYSVYSDEGDDDVTPSVSKA